MPTASGASTNSSKVRTTGHIGTWTPGGISSATQVWLALASELGSQGERYGHPGT
jgi:hypothetical protein